MTAASDNDLIASTRDVSEKIIDIFVRELGCIDNPDFRRLSHRQ